MLSAVVSQQVGRWSASEIHDTVAAIARQPMYATSIRESMLGRFFRFVMERLARMLSIFDGVGDPSFLIIITLIVALVVVAARVIVTRRAGDMQRRLGARTSFGRIVARDYWGDARAAALAADYMRATHALYAAVIDSLARSGVLSFHPSKTSGDYAREMVRRGGASPQDFRIFARDADRVIFGTRPPTAADYDRLLAAAERAVRASAAA